MHRTAPHASPRILRLARRLSPVARAALDRDGAEILAICGGDRRRLMAALKSLERRIRDTQDPDLATAYLLIAWRIRTGLKAMAKRPDHAPRRRLSPSPCHRRPGARLKS